MIDSKDKELELAAGSAVSQESYDVNLDDRGSVATFIASSFDKDTAAQLLSGAEQEA